MDLDMGERVGKARYLEDAPMLCEPRSLKIKLHKS